MSDVKATHLTCRKCGKLAKSPIYSEEHYGGRPALFWACPSEPCGYTWTLLIYKAPEIEIAAMRDRIRDLESGHE